MLRHNGSLMDLDWHSGASTQLLTLTCLILSDTALPIGNLSDLQRAQYRLYTASTARIGRDEIRGHAVITDQVHKNTDEYMRGS